MNAKRLTKLQAIQQAVNDHFAAHAEREAAYGDTIATDEHTAVTMLRDLLPLLPAVIILGDDNAYESETIIAATEVLESVTKMLLENAQP